MSFWLKDYAKMVQKINFLELKLQKPEITSTDREKTMKLLTEYRVYKDKFDKLIDAFEGIEHAILIKKYIEGKTLEVVAFEVGYSYNYIKQRHAAIVKQMKFAEKISGKW